MSEKKFDFSRAGLTPDIADINKPNESGYDQPLVSEQADKLYDEMYKDDLTGAYNSKFLKKRIKEFNFDKEGPLCVAFIDVNNLKQVNDNFGHYEGNELLKNVVNIISNSIRISKGDQIFRVGGDEFVVLLSKLNISEDNTQDKITEVIKEKINNDKDIFNNENPGINVDFAMGFSFVDDKNENLEEAIKIADEKMYQNKVETKQPTNLLDLIDGDGI